MVLSEPAKCSADPAMGIAFTLGRLGAQKEGTIAGEEPIWGKYGRNLLDGSWLIWNEMERVAHEDGVRICYGTRQLIRVALHKPHGAPLQALASDLYRLGGGLDAEHCRGPPHLF